MDLNVKTPFFLTQALHGALKAAATKDKLAKVINIASIDGIAVNPQETYSYHASKAGLIHLTKRMAIRLIRDNIVVTAIAPGAFASDMNRDARDHGDALVQGHSVAPHRHGRRHGRRRDLSRLARGRLCRRLDDHRRRRRQPHAQRGIELFFAEQFLPHSSSPGLSGRPIATCAEFSRLVSMGRPRKAGDDEGFARRSERICGDIAEMVV